MAREERKAIVEQDFTGGIADFGGRNSDMVCASLPRGSGLYEGGADSSSDNASQSKFYDLGLEDDDDMFGGSDEQPLLPDECRSPRGISANQPEM